MALRLAQFRQLLATRFPDQSQAETARALGVEPSALSRWLNGSGASFPQVAAVCAALGVPYTLLWDGEVPRRYAHVAPADPSLTAPPLAVLAERQWAAQELATLAAIAYTIAERAEAAAQRLRGATPPAAGAAPAIPGEAEESAGTARGRAVRTTPRRQA